MKKDLIARANELASPLAQIQKELEEDFGVRWTFPKNGMRKNGKSVRKQTTQPAVSVEQPVLDQKKIAMLERKLATQKNRLEQAQKNGKDAKAIQERIYELEDELRLVREKPAQ